MMNAFFCFDVILYSFSNTTAYHSNTIFYVHIGLISCPLLFQVESVGIHLLTRLSLLRSLLTPIIKSLLAFLIRNSTIILMVNFSFL